VFLSVSFMFISYKQLNRSEGMGVYFSCIFDLNDLLYKFTFNFFALNDFFCFGRPVFHVSERLRGFLHAIFIVLTRWVRDRPAQA